MVKLLTGFEREDSIENSYTEPFQNPIWMERERERERNVLFNDALNTFYLWLYGVRHMVKDYSDSEKEREREKCFI